MRQEVWLRPPGLAVRLVITGLAKSSGLLTALVLASGLVAPGCGIGQHPAALPPTLSFKSVTGGQVAVQSGLVVPSFGVQPRPRLDLAGEWKFEAGSLDQDLSFVNRDRSLPGLLEE